MMIALTSTAHAQARVIYGLPFGRPRAMCEADLAPPPDLAERDRETLFAEILRRLEDRGTILVDENERLQEWIGSGSLRLSFEDDPREINSLIRVEGLRPSMTYLIRTPERRNRVTTRIHEFFESYARETRYSCLIPPRPLRLQTGIFL